MLKSKELSRSNERDARNLNSKAKYGLHDGSLFNLMNTLNRISSQTLMAARTISGRHSSMLVNTGRQENPGSGPVTCLSCGKRNTAFSTTDTILIYLLFTE